MKNLITAALLILLFSQASFAQNKFYNFTLYGGINPKQLPAQPGLLVNRTDPKNEFVFNLKEVSKSYTFGIRKNIRFSRPFYGTLGVEYSQQEQHYSLLFRYAELPEDKELELTSNSKMMAIPVGVGVKLNKVDITSGLMLKFAMQPGLTEEKAMGFQVDKSKMEYGWYTGVGISIDRIRLGVQYEASLQRYGHNIMYKQNALELNSIPGNFSFRAGISF